MQVGDTVFVRAAVLQVNKAGDTVVQIHYPGLIHTYGAYLVPEDEIATQGQSMDGEVRMSPPMSMVGLDLSKYKAQEGYYE